MPAGGLSGAARIDRKRLTDRKNNVEGHPNLDALCFSIPTMMVVMMMVVAVLVVMMMTVPPRPDPDVNVGSMMVMMVVMTDHNLSGLNGACLSQSGIVGF